MVEKVYAWSSGAELDDHSRRKHKILREYLADYMAVRCVLPMQTRFRLAIVDGFAGAGRYKCGSPGSPLIFLEVLTQSIERLNIERAAQGKAKITFDVLLILNDALPDVIELLKTNIAPLVAEARTSLPNINLDVQFLSQPFVEAYPTIRAHLKDKGFESNVLFNLDQCGHSKVSMEALNEILSRYPSAEIFLTFAIQTLLTYLRKDSRPHLEASLKPFGVKSSELDDLNEIAAKQEWLGAAERIVFQAFKNCGAYTSPFSINNPSGWRYWMIHFANSYKARQVYNEVLHRNSSTQAHFGRSGLKMLSYDPRDEGSLYLFDQQDRENAVEELYDDIPRVVANFGDTIGVSDFYQTVYNETPAHRDDIHNAIMLNPDIEVVTPSGNERRKAHTIKTEDVLKLKPQRSFHEILFPNGQKPRNQPL